MNDSDTPETDKVWIIPSHMMTKNDKIRRETSRKLERARNLAISSLEVVLRIVDRENTFTPPSGEAETLPVSMLTVEPPDCVVSAGDAAGRDHSGTEVEL